VELCRISEHEGDERDGRVGQSRWEDLSVSQGLVSLGTVRSWTNLFQDPITHSPFILPRPLPYLYISTFSREDQRAKLLLSFLLFPFALAFIVPIGSRGGQRERGERQGSDGRRGVVDESHAMHLHRCLRVRRHGHDAIP
jgi:hypothetical protein